MLPGPPSCSSTSQEGSGHNNQPNTLKSVTVILKVTLKVTQSPPSISSSLSLESMWLMLWPLTPGDKSTVPTSGPAHIWSLHDPRSEARPETSEAASPHRAWRDQEAGVSSGSHPGVIHHAGHGHEIPGEFSFTLVQTYGTRYGLSTPCRLTIRNSARLFRHVLIYMGDLHWVLPALNLSTLNAGILIITQQVRLMMFSLNMVDYSMSFLSLST